MSRIAIYTYKPRQGKAEELVLFLKKSAATLLKLNLCTTREHLIAISAEGYVMHLFEWAEDSGPDVAPDHEEIRTLWAESEKLCDFVKPAVLKEFNEMFPTFSVVS